MPRLLTLFEHGQQALRCRVHDNVISSDFEFVCSVCVCVCAHLNAHAGGSGRAGRRQERGDLNFGRDWSLERGPAVSQFKRSASVALVEFVHILQGSIADPASWPVSWQTAVVESSPVGEA